MITTMHHLDFPAILAASVAVMLLGGAWFAWLFERQYAAVLGRADAPKTKPGPLFIIGPLLCMVVTTIGCNLLMARQGVSSLPEALSFGLVVGVCCLSATAMNMAINPNIPRPLAYGLLSAGYFVLAALIISATLYLMS